MKDIEFILIDTGSESNKSMMSDVGKMENGIQITDVYDIKNAFFRLLMKLHFSYKINCKFILPGKGIWNHYFVLNKLIKDNNKEYYILVVNNAIHKFSIKALNKLQSKDNVYLISLLLDSFEKLPNNIRKLLQKTKFDIIYSFQKSDCEKYGFKFTNQIYSRAELPKVNNNVPMNDVYFIGADKGRIEKIYSIYKLLISNGFVCNFTVVVNKKHFDEYKAKYNGLNLVTKRIGYQEILTEIANCKCILELCQEGQDGLTMRFYEAVFYNKKLITNNTSAYEHYCYNPAYMNVINDISDINLNMLRSADKVDYKYQGEMSPVYFIQRIVTDLKK